MPATTATTPSGIKDVDALLSSRKWAVLSFTYSFPTSGSFYGATYGSNEHKTGFEALNATQQAVARSVLQKYASVAAITFKEITESASVHADLRLAESDDGATAWGYYPSSNAAGGDSWYNNSSNMYDAPRLGNYAFHTFLHEIGHNLGLKHAH